MKPSFSDASLKVGYSSKGAKKNDSDLRNLIFWLKGAKMTISIRAVIVMMFPGICLLAQHPVSDKVVVTFAKPVMVGETRVEPGEYTIRQLTSAANPRVLEFSTDSGTKLQATAMAIPVLDNLNTKKTTVLVYEGATADRLHRIWIEGKSYGYEFPEPAGLSEQELAQSRRMVITGTYTPERREVAQAAPPPQRPTESSTTPSEAQQQPPPPQREPEPAPPAPPRREPEPAPVPQSEPPQPTPPAETRQTPPMPATATNWYTIALSGLLLMGLGLALERVKS
jgi:hypothetical protein